MRDPLALSTSKFFQLSDGKRMRYALFEPEKARATMLIALGRREFIEKKYTEMGSELLERGFRLIFFEWRGQGLSDRYLTGTRYQRDHISDFNIHLQDLNAFYKQVVKPCQTGPLLLTGHSMGGHLILRWLVEEQMSHAVAGVILTSPMLALAALPIHSVARAMTWTAVRLGHEADYAPAQHDYNEQDCAFDRNPLTHDPERFALMEKYFAAHPQMTVGGVTWGWMEAALQSMHHIQQRRYFDSLTMPLFGLLGSKDQVTPAAELSRIIKRMPRAHVAMVENAYHDVLNETDLYRQEAWRQIDKFLATIP